jgi:hypothetical protein
LRIQKPLLDLRFSGTTAVAIILLLQSLNTVFYHSKRRSEICHPLGILSLLIASGKTKRETLDDDSESLFTGFVTIIASRHVFGCTSFPIIAIIFPFFLLFQDRLPISYFFTFVICDQHLRVIASHIPYGRRSLTLSGNR